MFGHYFRTLDEKNRVIIPSKLRNKLGNIFYITIGPDKVLEIREKKSFEEFSQKIMSNNMLNEDARKFARLMLGNSEELKPDKTGRISISSSFLKIANITKKELVFVGVGTKIEIWSKISFEKFNSTFEEEGSIERIAKKLLKDGAEI